ncbi:hypothetical protein P154DRAFT_308955 [Amniculicola lignicola CBS 123094]|uniref:Uncharacterized protein n=1 Tax=Amniculicola lignicola CBS 123094 TaxID=1392246 RepID=A0A6A5W781_9PLEO|nr:hypothetical protein P154DRAFT_308955 [Amniculicola lignicola CBS 123094]
MASSQKSAWHIHWQIPLLMFGCFIASAGTAVGHHFLCDHLDGLPVINQTWNTRAGIALANIMKILLAASVTVSFTQQMWKTARSRFFSLKGVDSLFTASSNPFSLLDGEVLLHAKIAMLLALLIWYVLLYYEQETRSHSTFRVSPLITIIAPGSLGVTVHTTIQTNELSISTVNLSRSREDMSQSEQARAIDFTELTRITLDILPPGSGAQGYYRPSSRAIALIYQTVYGGRIADAISPCGSNCSFSQSFTAPAYKCSPVETEGAIPLYGSAWDVSRVEWYKAWNTTADFCDTMGGSASCNVFTGDEWIAGKIQVQYMYLPQSERELWEKNNTHPIAASAWQYSGFLCEQWFAQFDLQREYVNSVQQMNVTKT